MEKYLLLIICFIVFIILCKLIEPLEIGHKLSEHLSSEWFRTLKVFGYAFIFCFSCWLDWNEVNYAMMIGMFVAFFWLELFRIKKAS